MLRVTTGKLCPSLAGAAADDGPVKLAGWEELRDEEFWSR
jgi:hypothetical protein